MRISSIADIRSKSIDENLAVRLGFEADSHNLAALLSGSYPRRPRMTRLISLVLLTTAFSVPVLALELDDRQSAVWAPESGGNSLTRG